MSFFDYLSPTAIVLGILFLVSMCVCCICYTCCQCCRRREIVLAQGPGAFVQVNQNPENPPRSPQYHSAEAGMLQSTPKR